MTINLPRRIRIALYIIVAIGGPVVAYLMNRGVIGGDEFTLWTGLVTIVAALAGFNVPNDGTFEFVGEDDHYDLDGPGLDG